MAAKILLSVSLLFGLLLFCSDCGLQGVKASPTSKTSANRLDALRSFYPKKISVINETLAGNHNAGVRGIEFAELLYDGLVLTLGIPSNSSLYVLYLDGWTIDAVYGNVTWFEGEGNVWLTVGEENDSWILSFETFEWVLGYAYDIVAIVSRVVSKTVLLLREYSKYNYLNSGQCAVHSNLSMSSNSELLKPICSQLNKINNFPALSLHLGSHKSSVIFQVVY
jgi:hypothetical protein